MGDDCVENPISLTEKEEASGEISVMKFIVVLMKEVSVPLPTSTSFVLVMFLFLFLFVCLVE